MGIYDRLVQLNKSYIREQTARIEKIDNVYHYVEIKYNNLNHIRIDDLNDLYRQMCMQQKYIENISILSNMKLLTKYKLTKLSWENIKSRLRKLKKLNSFSILRIDNFDKVVAKEILQGNLLYYTPFFALIKMKEMNIKLVTDLTLMVDDFTDFEFEGLYIKKIYLSNLDFSKATRLAGMFRHCSSTEEIYFKDIDTRGILNFNSMFFYCDNLKKVNIEAIQTDSAEFLEAMFMYCSSLEELNLNHFKVDKVYSILNMFYGCSNLKTLEISNLCFQGGIIQKDVFTGCHKLDKESVKINKR